MYPSSMNHTASMRALNLSVSHQGTRLVGA